MNLRRLNRLQEFVERWRTYGEQPVGNLVRHPSVDQQSLLDLLSSEALDETAIMRILEWLRTAITERKPGRTDRLRPRGVTAKSSAMQDASVQRTVRRFTRRRRKG